MQRPMIWLVCTFAAGTALALCSSGFTLVIPLVVLSLAIVLGWLMKNIRPICFIIAAFLFGFLYTGLYQQYIIKPVSEIDGTPITMTFTALDYAEQYEDSQRVAVEVNGPDVKCWHSFRTLLYLPLTDKMIKPDDNITASVFFYQPKASEGFDKAAYYRSEGYYIMARSAKGIPITIESAAQHSLLYYPKTLTHLLHKVYAAHGTEKQAAFWDALTTGTRIGLTVHDKDHLKRAGLSHVIALSGLHISFLISLLMLIFGRRIGTYLAIPVLLLYFLMVGWSPSVFRACLMHGILLTAWILRKQNDSINALFFALFIVLLGMPTALMSVSLQLTFLASLGLLCFASRVEKVIRIPKHIPVYLNKPFSLVLRNAINTICATVLTAPVLLYHFGYLSVFSIFSNILALWMVSLLFPLVLLSGLIGICFSGLSGILLFIAGIMTDYIYWISDLIAGIPYGVLYCENRFDFLIAIGLSMITVLLLWKAEKKVMVFSLPALIGIIICISIFRGAAAQDDLKVSIFPENSGQVIIVSCEEHTVLIDCAGGEDGVVQDIEQYMDWHGIASLDYLILTSIDRTHAGNAGDLLKKIPVEKVIMPLEYRTPNAVYPTLKQVLEEQHVLYEQVAPETEASIADDSLGLSIFGGVPGKLMVRIQSEDQNILTVHALTPKMLLEYTEGTELKADTLIVSYSLIEGKDSCAQILKRIQPKQLILENGRNASLTDIGIPILNPKQSGEITIKTVR